MSPSDLFAKPGEVVQARPQTRVEQLLPDEVPLFQAEYPTGEAVRLALAEVLSCQPTVGPMHVADVHRFSKGGGERDRAPYCNHGIERRQKLGREGHAVTRKPEMGEAAKTFLRGRFEQV